MKLVYLILSLLLIVSCAQKIGIKNTPLADSNIDNAYIRTENIEIGNENNVSKTPVLKIISPQDRGFINSSTVVVQLQAENFKIAPMGSPVKDGEGHFSVWLDSNKKAGTGYNFTFENIKAGWHTLAAELVRNDNSSLNPRIMKTIEINVAENFLAAKIIQREFNIEADDNGFYPSTIYVKAGEKVTLHFRFRDAIIYYAGLDIKGPFPTIRYKVNGQQPITAEFTMEEPANISSYWPSTEIKKAELTVGIEK